MYTVQDEMASQGVIPNTQVGSDVLNHLIIPKEVLWSAKWELGRLSASLINNNKPIELRKLMNELITIESNAEATAVVGRYAEKEQPGGRGSLPVPEVNQQ